MPGNSFSIDTRQPSRRHLRWAWCAPAVAAGVAAAAPLSAGAVTSHAVVTTATVPGLGTVLVAGQRPLYLFTHDRNGKSTCTGKCAALFPPLVVTKSAAHHLGKLRGLKTIKRAGGQLQVTFHGHPLYFYAADHSLSTAAGQGLVRAWWTIRPSGAVVHTMVAAAPQAAPAPAPAPTSTSTSSPPTTSTSSGANSAGGHGGAPTTTPTMAPSPPTTAPPPPPPPAPTTTTAPPPPPTTTTTQAGGGGVAF